MPSRLRVKSVFGQRPVESQSKDSKLVYVISIAGEGKTEEQYFDGICDMDRTNLIRIERLEKSNERDTKSHPKHVIDLLNERKKQWELHGFEPNELWMVVDRDKQNVSVSQLIGIIDKCKSEGYNIALSNPTFEFWLLLHVTSIERYEIETLIENPKLHAKSKKRFIEKELSKILGGYNKKKLRFDDFSAGINDAIMRAKDIETNNEVLVNNLGTSVCLLVEKLLE
jgi:hypothetical protein